MAQKDLLFIGNALEELRAFPEASRREAGYQLHLVQEGEMPERFKSMKTVGPGTYEIIISEEGQAHRVFYVARFEEGVYVLHCFEKKTRKTASQNIDTGRVRYQEMLRSRS